ncbi:hypothetical protein RAM80_04700 [Pseudomonas sp. App30]|uniref:hypothetical protein n=1 Tax=Pseudomonas sp. App30 TaxID=3068990 RepID=UPI003A7FEB19
MNDLQTEEQMREALFGPSTPTEPVAKDDVSELQFVPTKRASAKAAAKKPSSSSLFPKLRMTLRVTKIFEDEAEILTHDARTLSSLLAEQEARKVAKKMNYKYIELVSIVQL